NPEFLPPGKAFFVSLLARQAGARCGAGSRSVLAEIDGSLVAPIELALVGVRGGQIELVAEFILIMQAFGLPFDAVLDVPASVVFNDHRRLTVDPHDVVALEAALVANDEPVA